MGPGAPIQDVPPESGSTVPADWQRRPAAGATIEEEPEVLAARERIASLQKRAEETAEDIRRAARDQAEALRAGAAEIQRASPVVREGEEAARRTDPCRGRGAGSRLARCRANHVERRLADEAMAPRVRVHRFDLNAVFAVNEPRGDRLSAYLAVGDVVGCRGADGLPAGVRPRDWGPDKRVQGVDHIQFVGTGVVATTVVFSSACPAMFSTFVKSRYQRV